ncbi:MAG: DNA-3-methyladenine glycosylase I [Anaerolineales bacterium]|nr:DNA-3-methyladenine glycosylase I [Anaerolineales bacterium]
MARTEPVRCGWAQHSPLESAYHDLEWGVPVHDDGVLFEFLILEGAQAGLSWSTILAKRENYRAALDGFDPAKIARYTPARRARLLQNPGLVRNRLKIESTVKNARAFLDLQTAFGSFDAYLWRFVDGAPLQNHWTAMKQVPASSPVSDALSRDLKARGFSFVGTTILYAYMQAVGLVNDHLVDCHRHAPIARLGRRKRS